MKINPQQLADLYNDIELLQVHYQDIKDKYFGSFPECNMSKESLYIKVQPELLEVETSLGQLIDSLYEIANSKSIYPNK